MQFCLTSFLDQTVPGAAAKNTIAENWAGDLCSFGIAEFSEVNVFEWLNSSSTQPKHFPLNFD